MGEAERDRERQGKIGRGSYKQEEIRETGETGSDMERQGGTGRVGEAGKRGD